MLTKGYTQDTNFTLYTKGLTAQGSYTYNITTGTRASSPRRDLRRMRVAYLLQAQKVLPSLLGLLHKRENTQLPLFSSLISLRPSSSAAQTCLPNRRGNEREREECVRPREKTLPSLLLLPHTTAPPVSSSDQIRVFRDKGQRPTCPLILSVKETEPKTRKEYKIYIYYTYKAATVVTLTK